jgi:hypothetical protein
MIRIHVSAEDLAQTRFAFSPLWETVESYRAILDPGRHALHLPWISWAREELGGWDLGPLAALVRAEGYMPDFLTPPPTSPFPEFLAEVELRVERSSRPVPLLISGYEDHSHPLHGCKGVPKLRGAWG